MNLPFTHLILCRYNLELYNSNPYKIKDKDLWMSNRTSKFELLLESLQRQTVKNFNFILFIDPKTPKKLKKKISNTLNEKISEIKFYISEDLPVVFFKQFNFDKEFLITSRIDSDDEYLPKFVETIQESFCNVEEILDVMGCQYDMLDNKTYTSGRKTPNSPFISLVEKSSNIKSVFHVGHSNVCKKFKCRFVNSDEILYKQNIHENNLMNKIIGELII